MAEAQATRLREVTGGPPELLIPRCVSLKMIDDQKLLQFLALKFNMVAVDIDGMEIAPDVSALFPIAELQRLQSVILKNSDTTVRVALADPTFIPAVTEKIKNTLHKNTEVVLTSFTSLQAHLKKRGAPNLTLAPAPPSRTQGSMPTASRKQIAVKKLETTIPENGDAVNVLNAIFSEAVRFGASDIHIEPTKTAIRVRVRIDGTMVDLKELNIALKETLVARTKVLAETGLR